MGVWVVVVVVVEGAQLTAVLLADLETGAVPPPSTRYCLSCLPVVLKVTVVRMARSFELKISC